MKDEKVLEICCAINVHIVNTVVHTVHLQGYDYTPNVTFFNHNKNMHLKYRHSYIHICINKKKNSSEKVQSENTEELFLEMLQHTTK